MGNEDIVWYVEQIDECARDILFSLRTDLPVSTQSEYGLCSLCEDIAECKLGAADLGEYAKELIYYFLDNPDEERAWNARNSLIGYMDIL